MQREHLLFSKMPWPCNGRTRSRDLESQTWPPWALRSRWGVEMDASSGMITSIALCWHMSVVGLDWWKVQTQDTLGLVTQLLIYGIPNKARAVRIHSRGNLIRKLGSISFSITKRFHQWTHRMSESLFVLLETQVPFQVSPDIRKHRAGVVLP